MITVEIVEGPDRIKEWYANWEALFLAAPYEPSLSIEWSQALLDTHLGRDQVFLMLLRDSTELLAAIPLCIQRTVRKRLSLLTLFPLAEYFNTHSDLLLKTPSRELISSFLKALFRLKWRWDIFRMNRFVADSPVLGLIEASLKTGGIKHEVRRAEPSFYIEFATSYEEYLEKRNSHFRNNLKRSVKKMNALGQVEFLGMQHFNDVADAYKVILSIEAKSWKHQHGTAITSTTKQREFYRELSRGAYEKGRLRLSILNLNREPIAFEMGLVNGTKYYGVHNSYDEAFKKENPGTVLLAKFIEDLIRDGIREYDFFGEPFEWESRWTDKYRWHKSLLIYNQTPKGRLFSLFNTLKDKLGRKPPDQPVLQNPRDIRPLAD